MNGRTPSVSGSRVAKLGLGGAIGGLITYLILEPVISPSDGMQNASEAAGYILTVGATVGASIGACLVAADELPVRSASRLLTRVTIGLIAGALLGIAGTFVAEIIFSRFVMTGFLPLVIIGRTIGWAVMGCSAGICPGIAARSSAVRNQGAAGGLIGGALGGILFDALAQATSSGSVSRFTGFVLMGLAVGVAVALVAELSKVCWLTGINGPLEGRSFSLDRPISAIGRDELVDISLFGDPSVEKRHAILSVSDGNAVLTPQPGTLVVVNGARAQTGVTLSDGDIVEIGKHRLRFNSRNGAKAPIPNYPQGPERTTFIPSSPVASQAAPTLCRGEIAFLNGQNTGQVLPLFTGAILGRDPRCDISIMDDPHISRQHARFVLEPTGWTIEDGGSSNGILVNGVRISRQLLVPGDLIQAGSTAMQFM